MRDPRLSNKKLNNIQRKKAEILKGSTVKKGEQPEKGERPVMSDAARVIKGSPNAGVGIRGGKSMYGVVQRLDMHEQCRL